MKNMKTIAVAATAAIALTASTAGAASLITSSKIADGTIMNRDIHRGTISENRLDRGVVAKLNRTAKPGTNGTSGSNGSNGSNGAVGPKGATGATGPKGDTGARGPQGDAGVTNIESDGPYPGATDLGSMTGQGDNSDALVTNNGQPQTVWVQCAPGKTALGGGFTLASDAGAAAQKAMQVVESAPTQVKNGAIVYEPITGDEAGSFVPNAWMVTAVNNGTGDVVVRPHVVCADVS